jgi:hypothetical protein
MTVQLRQSIILLEQAGRGKAEGSNHRHHGVRSKTNDTTVSSWTSLKTTETTVSLKELAKSPKSISKY